MATGDRKIKCTTRLGALDVPRSSAHKAEEFVGFRTLFSHFFCSSSLRPGTKGLPVENQFLTITSA